VKAEKEVANQSRLERDALRTELKSAREEIHRLTVDAESLRRAKKDLEVDAAGVRKTVAEQQEAIRRSFSERDRFREELTSAGKEINALQSTLSDFETARDKLNEELSKVREEVKNQHKIISQKDTDLKTLVPDLALANKRLEALNIAMESATAARAGASAEREGLRRELDKQQQTIKEEAEIQKELAKALALSKTERTAMEKRLHDSDTQRRSLTENLGKMRKDLDLQREAMALYQDHSKSQAIELAGMHDTVTILTEKLKSTTSELETATDERERLTKALKKVKTDLEFHEKALVNARSDKKAMESTFGEMRSQMVAQDEILKSMQIDRDRLNKEVALLRQNMKGVSDAAIKSLSERNALKAKLKSAEELIDGLKTETGDLRSERDKQYEEFIKVRRVVENQRKSIRQTKDDLEILGSALASANQTIVELNRDLESARAVGMDEKAGQARLSQDLDVLQGTLEKTAATQKDIGGALASAGEEIEALKSALVESQIAWEALNAELVASRKRIVNLEDAFRQSPRDRPAGDPSEVSESSDIAASSPLQPDQDVAAIHAFVRSWSSAWERKDVKAYLSHYSKEFQPPGGIGRAEWSGQRRKRLLKPVFINIGVSDLQVKTLDGSRGEVSFTQIYLSDSYFDRVIKTLDIQLENGAWKIMRETSTVKQHMPDEGLMKKVR
jgi:chromosome segregation ATPase